MQCPSCQPGPYTLIRCSLFFYMVYDAWFKHSLTRGCHCCCLLVSHPKRVAKRMYFAAGRHVHLLLPCFPAYTVLSEPCRYSQDLIYLGAAFGQASTVTLLCKNLNTNCGVCVCFVGGFFLVFFFPFSLLTFQAQFLAEGPAEKLSEQAGHL